MKTILKYILVFMAASTFVQLQPVQATVHAEQPFAVNLPRRIEQSPWAQEMRIAFQAAHEAGIALLEIQRGNIDLGVEQKVGYQNIESPVTIADKQANSIICNILHQKFPTYGILTEEESDIEATTRWREAEMTWIIDPLDGTEAFINKGQEYGVLIGLTYQGRSVAGMNYYPESDTYYFAVEGCGAYKQVGQTPALALRVPAPTAEILPIRNTKTSETAPIYEKLLGQEITDDVVRNQFAAINGCGLRICKIAEGIHNLYISTGTRGGLWDYCSADVVLKEAGGDITDLDGNPIDYRNEEMRLTRGAIVSNNSDLHAQVVQIQQELLK